MTQKIYETTTQTRIKKRSVGFVWRCVNNATTNDRTQKFSLGRSKWDRASEPKHVASQSGHWRRHLLTHSHKNSRVGSNQRFSSCWEGVQEIKPASQYASEFSGKYLQDKKIRDLRTIQIIRGNFEKSTANNKRGGWINLQ
eukprot:c14262_g1_i1.p1 GENE.c14262_g1_i1~~c14262_g1_i1.p1  ORF type:complete len:141 (-),score=13.46 c14262_g1_i1:118-540(-)